MAAKTVENTRAGTTGVDKCRRPAPSRHLGCIDTERGPAPVDMRVEIDKPGHDEQPAYIDDLGTVGREIAPDFGYLSAFEDEIRHCTPRIKFGGDTKR